MNDTEPVKWNLEGCTKDKSRIGIFIIELVNERKANELLLSPSKA